MVLSIGTDGDADYYLGHQTDYYTGGSEPVGRWYTPDGQFGLVDGEQINNDIFRKLMDGIDPTNPDPATNVIGRPPKDPRKKRVSSYDLTFSVPKSVSILWAISDSQMRGRIEQLVDQAVRRTLQTAQDHTAFIRRGRNGTDIQQSRLFGAIFQHGDARPMKTETGEVLSDMNLHHHCVVMNLGQDDRGEWYALHAKVIMDWKMALGATHHAELARILQDDLGCRIRTVGKNGEFDVIGVPDDVLARFSRRRALVTESLKAYGLTSADAPELAAAITRMSREAKPDVEHAEGAQDRFDRWAREALELGFSVAEVLACFDNPFTEEEERARDLAFDERLQTIATDITETEATLELGDVHRAVAALCAEHGRGADAVERIVADLVDPTPLPADLLSWDDDRFDSFIEEKIGSRKLVTLPSTLADKAGRPLHTAPDLVRAERGIWQACDRHRFDERHIIPTDTVEAFIKDLHRKAAEPTPSGQEPHLAPTEEQEHALRHATTRAGLVSSLEGAAGAGKSVTLKQITALYRDVLGPQLGVDYRVIGCSAKWLTAKAMIDDADLADEDARAAAKWIADIKLGREIITERTILLVDEAGQMGDRDLYDLLKPFTDAGAKVILTGDRAQQRSVGAGPALDIVAAAVGSFRLERTQRMRPQADDVLIHRDGLSREEAIIRVHGLSDEQQRILVKGATHVLREEIRARFRDHHYTLSPEDVLIWAENLSPLDAVRKAASLRGNQKALASLVRGHLSEDARENALAWAADPDATATPAMVYHYLHGQPWQVAEKRASLLSRSDADALLHGHDRTVRAKVLAWVEDETAPVTLADELRWLGGLDRRTAEARANTADPNANTTRLSTPPSATSRAEGAPDRPAVPSSVQSAENALASTQPSKPAAGKTDATVTALPLPPDRAAAVKAAARAWAKRPDTARAKAEDVLHHIFGLSWCDAFKRIDGMTQEERTALLSSPFERDYNAAEARAIAKADEWATDPKNFITAADVLVHVYGFSRSDAEARASAMTPLQRRRMVDLDYHHTSVRAAGQMWARQAATDVSYAPEDPAGAMQALQAFAAHGNLVWKETPEDALIAAVEEWKAYMASNPNANEILATPSISRKFAVVIAKSNEAVRVQNVLMRNHLRERGLLGAVDTIVRTQARQRIANRHLEVDLPISVGEQILFTERDKSLDVVNGTIGCVKHIAPSALDGHAILTVQLGSGDGTRTITFDTADYADDTTGRAFLEHSYAVTTFSVQGMTTAAAFAQVDSSQKSNSVYVAMSRGKGLTKLFASTQTENNFLAAELPLSQKLRASFGERDRLRSLARFIARGQTQSDILRAFIADWKDNIQTIRPEDYFRHKDIEWLSLSDEDLAAAIDDMVNAHRSPLPEDPETPPFDPDAIEAPSQEWLDRYDFAPPPAPPPPPNLPLFQAKSRRPPTEQSPLPPFPSPAPSQTIAPWQASLPISTAPPSSPVSQRDLLRDSVSPQTPPTALHDSPIKLSSLPLILQRAWLPPPPVNITTPPTIFATAPPTAESDDSTAATTSSAPPALPNWQPRREPLNSFRAPASVRASPARVARHLLSTRSSPHLRPGATMPRDDNTAIAPRNRRNFRSYNPATGREMRGHDPRIGEEMKEIIEGGVDFRDVLEKAGWKPAGTNDPSRWCSWTNGSTTKLDPENTISIRLFKDGWGWKSKDGAAGGNLITWGREFDGWPPKGDAKGYVDTWKRLREFLPGAPPLDQNTPLTPEQEAAQTRARQEAAERREAQRLATEDTRRQEIADTHARAAEYWPKLSTPAATSVGNILDRRGITRATQNAYADTIRFGSNHQGPFVAFKHVAADGAITGAERKGDGWNLFTEGSGGKALALFGDPNAALSRIVIVETGVDAVSRAQLDGCPADVLYVSTGGNSSMRLNEDWGSHFAAEHIVALARRHPNAVIDLATDRDRGGNEQATGWAALLDGHPGGIERSTPAHTNDWNNELRAPNQNLLKIDPYRKDLRKAAPPLPPPPVIRPDLLAHWQAYEAARPHLQTVLESIARDVGAWDDTAYTIDRRKWRDAPLARTLWDAIHEGISPETDLPASIAAAIAGVLPRWHAWHAQALAFDRLSDTFRQTLAGDPDTGLIDQKRLKQCGAAAYLKEIQDAILTQSLPLDRAISAAIGAIDAADGEAIRAAQKGRGNPPPDRTAARAALIRMRAHIEAHPEDFTLPPADISHYPALANLSALSRQLAATPPLLPDPDTWQPTEPAHDPVADARAAAHAKATAPVAPGADGAPAAPSAAQDATSNSTTEATETRRPFADPAKESVASSPSSSADLTIQSRPSRSSPASSDATPAADPLDLAALSTAGTNGPDHNSDADPAVTSDPTLDDDAHYPHPLDDEDRPPTEEEIAADLARRAAAASAGRTQPAPHDLDPESDFAPAHEDDAIMDTLTSPPPSAAAILAAEQQEAATLAANLQAADEQADRARQDSDARRLRAEDARNRMDGIAASTTARPPKPKNKATATGPGKDMALGEDFGVDNSPEKQRHAFLKELGEYYKTHFAAKHEQEIAHVRIRPGQHADEVVVEFRDGSRIRDDGKSIMLDSKGTPQKAELLIEIAAARGMSPLRLKGSQEFKRDLAKACYEAGIEVLNRELQDYMLMLAERFPERAGINAKESNFEDPHAANSQPTPSSNEHPAADPDQETPTTANSSTTASDQDGGLNSSTSTVIPAPTSDPLAQRLVDLTAARVARAETTVAALATSLDQTAVDTASETLAAARTALNIAERIAAIRAGTLKDDPITHTSFTEDSALRVLIQDELALATSLANTSSTTGSRASTAEAPTDVADSSISTDTQRMSAPTNRKADIRDAAAEDLEAAIEAGHLPSEIGISAAARAELDYFESTEGSEPDEAPHDRVADIRDAAAEDLEAAIEAGHLPSEIGISAAARAELDYFESTEGSEPDEAPYDRAADIRDAATEDLKAAIEADRLPSEIGVSNPTSHSAPTSDGDAVPAADAALIDFTQASAPPPNPDPLAVLRDALATLADDRAPDMVRAHAAMKAAEARTEIDVALSVAQAEDAMATATPSAPSILDATLAEAFPTVAVGRLWLSQALARHNDGPAALTAAMRVNPNGVIGGDADQDTIAYLSRLADVIEADPSALQSAQSTALTPETAELANDRTQHIAALADVLASTPDHNALLAAERMYLTNVNGEHVISEATTPAYAARVAPFVAAYQASATLDWTIAAHLPGYHNAGALRPALLADGLPLLDAQARIDIQAAAKAAAHANRALQAANPTVTPDHLRQDVEQHITTVYSILATTTMAPAPIAYPVDPTAAAIHDASRALLSATTPAQRALSAARLLGLVAESAPTVAALEATLSNSAGDTALANIPNAVSALEIRDAIRDAIPWSILPPVPGSDASDTRKVVAGQTTNLDAAAAALYHAATPTSYDITASELSADATLAPVDRGTLTIWLHLDSTMSAAVDAWKAAQSPTASPADRLQALNTAENAILETRIAAHQLGATSANHAFNLAVSDLQTTSYSVAQQAAHLIASDPASLQHALAHGAEHSLNTYLAQAPIQQVPSAPHLAQDFEPDMA